MKRLLLFLLSLQAASISQASIVQFFWHNNYFNSANLSLVENYFFLSGASGVGTHAYFKGTSASSQIGHVGSAEFQALPYLRVAARVNPKVVIGLNITEPYYIQQNFRQGAITQFDGTQTNTLNYDISPQISYEVNPNLSLGVGINFNRYQNLQSNYVGQSLLGNIVNDARAWSYGWNAGIAYSFCGDRLSLTYYSKLNPKLNGRSTAGLLVNNDFKVRGFNLPATTVLNYKHMWNPMFLMGLTLYYSQWDKTNTIRFINTATSPLLEFPFNYHNGKAIKLSALYKLNPLYAVIGDVLYDGGVTGKHTRVLNANVDKVTFVHLALNREFNRHMSLQVGATYGFNNNSIDHPLNLATNARVENRYLIGNIEFIYNC